MKPLKVSRLSKEAVIHETLDTHEPCNRFGFIGSSLPIAICKSCHHILILKESSKWKVINQKEASSFSDFTWVKEYKDFPKVIKVYESNRYLDSPAFAYYLARDVIKKPTKTSKKIASLDEVYGFHYANDIEGRTTPEQAKEFQRLFKKRMAQNP